jgi:hypothetical protein
MLSGWWLSMVYPKYLADHAEGRRFWQLLT